MNMLHIAEINSLLDNYKSLYWISPALCIVGILITNLLLQLITTKSKLNSCIKVSTALGLGCVFYATWIIGQKLPPKAQLSLFNNLLAINTWVIWAHLILIAITLFIVLISIQNKLSNNLIKDTSLYVFMLVTTLLGSYLLVMANHWLVVYVSTVCMTLGVTMLIYESEPSGASVLASIRYLIYSVIASAVMLVGLSYLYGSTGTLMLTSTLPYHNKSEIYALLYTIWPIGFFLGLIGLFMMLGIFPFQFWIPSVYQPTSFPLIAYLSSVPKIAGIAFMIRLHQVIILSNPSLANSLEILWAILAILTMLIGHLAAFKTSDAKKLLAYGTIAQTGFLLSLMVTDTHTSFTYVAYYLIVYGIMNIASWLGLKFFNDVTNSTSIKNYAGLGRQFPLPSICLLVTVAALIGLPPTAGFTAKFLLFNKLWEKAHLSQNPLLFTLLLASIIGTLFALYYYLRIPYLLFFKPTKLQVHSIKQRTIQFIVIGLNILLLGLFLINKTFISWLDRLLGG